MGDGFSGPPGFSSGGFTDPLTGEFQPGTTPAGTTAVWTRGTGLRLRLSSAGGVTMAGSRAKFPAQSASAGGSEDMDPHA